MPEQVFNYTGANQTFTVPTWVSTMQVEVAGAQGGNSIFAQGGQGGLVMATIPVVPGEVLTIVVGGQSGWPSGGAAGAPGGGGSTSDPAGIGGGHSAIQNAGATRYVVAGAGGGSGATYAALAVGGSVGGAGGQVGLAGANGSPVDGGFGPEFGQGGGGGTASAGGAGGLGELSTTNSDGVFGSSLQGGRGGNGITGAGNFNEPGGGGGGGHFGGGGGGASTGTTVGGGGGGGGGSSSVIAGATGVSYVSGARAGNGYVKLTWGAQQSTAPTGVQPTAGSIVTTNTPILALTIPQQGSARQRGEWQLATTADFTQNLRVITEPTSDLKVSGQATEVVPLASKLFQTTWYIRARTLDEGGNPSPWSGVQQFVVAHTPSGSPVAPSSGQVVVFDALGLSMSWLFSDPSPDDAQSAYQVVVTDSATGATVADTGKVVSVAKFANVAIPASKKNSVLSWKVRVWDQDNVVGNYSNAVTFVVADAPTVVIDTMTTVNTSSPIISFNFTPVVAPLAMYRVTVTRQSDGALAYDSGWRAP